MTRRLAALGHARSDPATADPRPAGPLDTHRTDAPVRHGAEVGVPVILDLIDAACGAGASVPRALEVVGAAIGGERGRALGRIASGLALGAGWDEAWAPSPAALAPAGEALRGAWDQGLSPAGSLRTAALSVRALRHAAAMEAAGRLGVRLVLPLGLCFLPAFVLVGLVPVLLAMAGSALGP